MTVLSVFEYQLSQETSILTVTVEQTSALSAESHFVQLLIGATGNGSVISGTSFLSGSSRDSEITRQLCEREVVLMARGVLSSVDLQLFATDVRG